MNKRSKQSGLANAPQAVPELAIRSVGVAARRREPLGSNVGEPIDSCPCDLGDLISKYICILPLVRGRQQLKMLLGTETLQLG